MDEVIAMPDSGYLTFFSNKKEVVLNTQTILYAIMSNKQAEIHTNFGTTYTTRLKFSDIESRLGDNFIKIHRGCVVSAMAIHEITDKINLINGESLIYTQRKKKEIINLLHKIQKNVIDSFRTGGMPLTDVEYKKHYNSFENLPFAFTDIEFVFNDNIQAIDWIFRYGNKALAKLEKTPLEKLIGSKFGDVFINMDPKWIKCYERAALYGERLELMDYSPEIDTYLKVICFPTFRGHCGCLLFDISEIEFMRSSNDSDNVISDYLGLTGGETD